MRVLVVVLLLAAISSSSDAAPASRRAFAAKLAKVKPGMPAARVKQLLGAPDDIVTERDPGGIVAARTVEVWRWGARGHLAFGTLGTVHVQADGKVQYVFGARGTPYTGIAEPRLRELLETVDAVPSYNEPLDPRALIAAVNALQPLGKDRALAVIDEYLRVSSPLDDGGREGVFLLLRALFDVPPAGMPPMLVGAPDVAPPRDRKALPRFPLVIVADVPLKLVRGYALGGEPQSPESDVAAFRKGGTLRAQPLVPDASWLDAIDAFIAGPLAQAITVDDSLRAALYDQVLRFAATAYRARDGVPEQLFAAGSKVTERWARERAALANAGSRWNPRTQRLELPGGRVLPALPTGSPRVWWEHRVPGTTKWRVTLERKTDRIVDVELRIETTAAPFAPDTIRFIDVQSGNVIAHLAYKPSSGAGTMVLSRRITLARGRPLRVELASGERGPVLVP